MVGPVGLREPTLVGPLYGLFRDSNGGTSFQRAQGSGSLLPIACGGAVAAGLASRAGGSFGDKLAGRFVKDEVVVFLGLVFFLVGSAASWVVLECCPTKTSPKLT